MNLDRLRPFLSLWGLGACALVSPLAYGQTTTVDYQIVVNTASNSGAGTDNWVRMTVYGEKGSFTIARLNGSQESGSPDNDSISHADIGKIQRISLKLSDDVPFGDDWTPRDIKITGSDGSTATFTSFGEIDSGSTREFRPTSVYYPVTIVVNELGEPEVRTETITKCQFADNSRSSTPQDLMRYTETWSEMNGVEFSQSTATTLSVSATVGYTSPASALGSVSASVTGGWQNTVESGNREVTETVRQSEFDWTFSVGPRVMLLRCVDFEIPWGYQLVSDGQHSFIMKGVSRPVTPIPGFIQEMPQTDTYGNVVPVLESDITSHLDHFNPGQKQQLQNQYLPEWRNKGWVTSDPSKANVSSIASVSDAISQGRSVEEIRGMVDQGMPVTTQDLNTAVSPGSYNKELATLLLDRGAKPDASSLAGAIQARDTTLTASMLDRGAPVDRTHVRSALESNQTQLAYTLMDRGVSGLTTDDLRLAVGMNDAQLAGRMINAGAPSDVSLLVMARQKGNTQMLNSLAAATPANHAALEHAAQYNDTAMFQSFVSRGARLSNNGPIDRALDEKNLELARMGLRAGGDANKALSTAIGKRYMAGIKLCLDEGADPSPALDYALSTSDQRFFGELITRYGADPNLALSKAVAADQIDFGRVAIQQGRADPGAALPGVAAAGRMNWVRFLVESGANATAGAMPAIEGGQTQTLAYLISANASCGDSAHLNAAIQKGSLPMVELLVAQAGADAESGRRLAIELDQVDTVRYLLGQGATATGIEVPSSTGSLRMVKLLSESGAPVDPGIRPAFDGNHTEVALYLLEQGARTDELLPISAGKGNLTLVRALLERGVDPQEGLMPAVEATQVAVTQALLEGGADASGPDYIRTAVAGSSSELVRLLESHGADVNFVDQRGQTFLHHAAAQPGKEELVRTLIDLGLGIDNKDKAGETPLHVAARVGKDNLDVVQLLIDSGADVNSENKEGRCVLKDAKGMRTRRLLRKNGARRR